MTDDEIRQAEGTTRADKPDLEGAAHDPTECLTPAGVRHLVS